MVMCTLVIRDPSGIPISNSAPSTIHHPSPPDSLSPRRRVDENEHGKRNFNLIFFFFPLFFQPKKARGREMREEAPNRRASLTPRTSPRGEHCDPRIDPRSSSPGSYIQLCCESLPLSPLWRPGSAMTGWRDSSTDLGWTGLDWIGLNTELN